MNKKLRGHTANSRPSKKSQHEESSQIVLPRRPQTSLGFDRDSPGLTNFLSDEQVSRPIGRTSKNPRERKSSKTPYTTRKVTPLSNILETFEKQEKSWERLRHSPGPAFPIRGTRKIEKGDEKKDFLKRPSETIGNRNRKIGKTQPEEVVSRKIPPNRSLVKAWSEPDGLKKTNGPRIKSRHSVPLKLDKESKGNLANSSNLNNNRSGTHGKQNSPNQRFGRNKLLSVEPLKSIIETDDIDRLIENEDESGIEKLQNSFSYVSVDDILLNDVDDSHFDTDLEEEFPAPPPKEYDPAERRTYIESCLSQGVIPVSYLLKRLGDRTLTMRHHGLGPHGTRPLANALLKNTCIEEIDLTDNDLQADGGIFIALTLYENLYITNLNLSENFLRVDGGLSLAKLLLFNTSLKKLVLKGNHFTDKVAKAFAEALKDNRTLQHLDLSYNEFGEHGGLYIGAGLGLNYGLETLNLSWNSIRNKGAVSMAAALKTNDSLKVLNLSWNGLAFVGALAFTRHLKKNDTLKDLDISNNRIGPKGAQRLSVALKMNASIECFRIGLNPIGDEGVHAILEAAKQNTRIKFLGLEDITVSHKIYDEILKLESERDIIIRTGGRSGHAQETPPPSGMEILVQFIQDNRLRLKDLFFQFDKDHSGDITREEFKAGLKETGIHLTEKQLDVLIESIDIDQSNTIDYSEIIYGRETVMKERRFQKKVAIRTEQREQESIKLPKVKGFED